MVANGPVFMCFHRFSLSRCIFEAFFLLRHTFGVSSSGFIGHDPLVDLRGRRFVLEGGDQVLPDRDELGDILSTY